MFDIAQMYLQLVEMQCLDYISEMQCLKKKICLAFHGAKY